MAKLKVPGMTLAPTLASTGSRQPRYEGSWAYSKEGSSSAHETKCMSGHVRPRDSAMGPLLNAGLSGSVSFIPSSPMRRSWALTSWTLARGSGPSTDTLVGLLEAIVEGDPSVLSLGAGKWLAPLVDQRSDFRWRQRASRMGSNSQWQTTPGTTRHSSITYACKRYMTWK
ncbi:hypothetical protein L209DRAFT_239315 [Thermothelomyces heterothallicus CBS 203.75]